MDIKELRDQIDVIDDELVKLYLKRMDTVAKIAEKKSDEGSSVNDGKREKEIVYRITKDLNDDFKIYVKELYSAIFTTSKAYQTVAINRTSETAEKLKKIYEAGQEKFPVSATVAVQGVLGSNSYAAATKLFPISDITFVKSFEGVFNAVAKGLCEYGILPIENSTAGSVNEVYDLMKKYDFHIVKAVRIKINHCLAGVKGAKKSDIKTVVSHAQALYQCGDYLKEMKVATVAAENTATAAKELAAKNDETVAVLCSEECAELYGLDILDRSVQDNSSNYTRFICIGKKLQVFEGSNKISVMTSLQHEPGSLNKTLARFAALGLDLTKIESRPISGSSFEFMFYFDFDGNVFDRKIISLIAELENSSDKFGFLGSYQEII